MKRFKEIKNALQLEGDGSIMYDRVGDFPITIFLNTDTHTIVVKTIISDNVYSQISSQLEEAFLENSFKKGMVKYKNEILMVTILKKENALERYMKTKDILNQFLSVRKNDVLCAHCNGPECNELAVVDGFQECVHQTCQDEYIKKASMIKKTKVTVFNCLSGALGAFLGASLVMGVAFLFIYILNVSFGWLYMFSSFCAVAGYVKFKGPDGIISLLISLLSSTFALFVFMFVNWYSVLHSMGVTLNEDINIVTMIINGIFSIEVFTAFGFELIFFFMGIVMVLIAYPKSIKKRKKTRELEQNYRKMMLYGN